MPKMMAVKFVCCACGGPLSLGDYGAVVHRAVVNFQVREAAMPYCSIPCALLAIGKLKELYDQTAREQEAADGN